MKQIRFCAHVAALTFVSLVLLGLSGCGSLSPLPTDTFYRLKITPPEPKGSSETYWTEGFVRVAKFRGSGVHRERAIAYSEPNQVVVKQHRYHLWIDSPEHMLQKALVVYLRTANVAPLISSSDFGNDGLEIHVQIRQMDQVVTKNGADIVVALAFELVQRKGRKTLLLAKEYRESRSVSRDELSAVAMAMAEAIGVIFERFVAEVSALDLAAPFQ
ncbi:MAG TPA: hypothetical protein DGR97_02530 [Gammaproteobacteria bacterium]|nr:hypothetical protein [Gammaproteobacteria bacterium]|tara:strand:- start:448 stop:1095 length:648 start_codon:yes stop_codon:yes gene_type:complete